MKKLYLSGNNKYNKTNKISTFNGQKFKNKDNLSLSDNSNLLLQNKTSLKKSLKLDSNKPNLINGKVNSIQEKSILTLKMNSSIKNFKISSKEKIPLKHKGKNL